MRPEKKCPICRGRGYIRCDCWPGDYICGWDDEPCDNCESTGWIYDDEDDWELLPPDDHPIRGERIALEAPHEPDLGLPDAPAGGAAEPAEEVAPPSTAEMGLGQAREVPAGALDVGDIFPIPHVGTIGEHG